MANQQPHCWNLHQPSDTSQFHDNFAKNWTINPDNFPPTKQQVTSYLDSFSGIPNATAECAISSKFSAFCQPTTSLFEKPQNVKLQQLDEVPGFPIVRPQTTPPPVPTQIDSVLNEIEKIFEEQDQGKRSTVENAGGSLQDTESTSSRTQQPATPTVSSDDVRKLLDGWADQDVPNIVVETERSAQLETAPNFQFGKNICKAFLYVVKPNRLFVCQFKLVHVLRAAG